MVTLVEIIEYLSSQELDVRKTRFSRFMDQKLTPDVLALIADCVLNFVGNDPATRFKAKDIQASPYLSENIRMYFGKPDPMNPSAAHEYDKLVGQPLRMLDNAGVLTSCKRGNAYVYEVKRKDILEYVAGSIKQAFEFLYYYIMEVLDASGELSFFEAYKAHAERGTLDESEYQQLKRRFTKFVIGNTAINGETEVRRIFPKVLNVYAVKHLLPGSLEGRLSPSRYYFTDLLYNISNFRDINKTKGISRQEAAQFLKEPSVFNDQNISKAMKIVRTKHKDSEVRDRYADGKVTAVHHIFPRSSCPQIAHYPENMIALTARQHTEKAHPDGNTQQTDRDYQMTCLLAKADSIERSLAAGESIYDKQSFLDVLKEGLTLDIDADPAWSDIRSAIMDAYS